MINHQLALVKREIWEHRSIYMTPAVIASIVTLGVLAMLAFASGFAAELDVAIFGAQNLAGEPERKAVLTGFFLGTSWVFLVALMILTVFYSLDSLYAERKDKSILFWRSLPITDAETVISKLLTAIFVLPIATVAGIIVTHLINLIVLSVWVSMKGGDGGMLVWGSVALLDNWLAAFIIVVASGIWMSPFIGWFLLVSAYTKRSPLLMAFMPLIVIGLLEGIVLRSHVFAENVLGRGDGIPLFRKANIEQFFEDEQWRIGENATSLLTHIDVVQFVTTPATWAGIVVCGLLCTGAIYVRRFRDES
ncbi:MAG: ABC-2 transporter permease [Gammaproteobacteria bacterium]|nr:ABC-2 transporter permease [Gammaproteobacteria bacterium]MDH5239726.1 ABC-2 transporter permease [Gammaproteobacteria bacterium]MDH5583425.1 ABC-2 transporter permease [Gammaproteobacteria bacterium]